MKHGLVPLVAGAALVGVAAMALAFVGWDWAWFALANGVLAVLLLVLARGSMTGADERRPPGRARVSAARWAGPMDPDRLGDEERALYPSPDAEARARAEDVSTGFSFLWAAVPPAVAAVAAFFPFL